MRYCQERALHSSLPLMKIAYEKREEHRNFELQMRCSQGRFSEAFPRELDPTAHQSTGSLTLRDYDIAQVLLGDLL